MADDIIDWLTAQRDEHAARRAEAMKVEDWGTINIEDAMATNFYVAIQEIESSRKRIAAMERFWCGAY